MADHKRILIVRPSALGDVCRSVGVLASLRASFPRAQIDWLVQDDFAPVIEPHPAVNEIVRFPRRRFSRWWRNPKVAWDVFRWFGGLRRARYDLVIDCQGLGRSGLMTWMTRARRRVGYRSARELGWLGYNVRHPRPAASHTVDQMHALLAAEGLEVTPDLRLYVDQTDRGWWAAHVHTLGLEGEDYAVFAPTSRWMSKRWPAASWRQLLQPIGARGFRHIFLIGAPNEASQVQEVLAGTSKEDVTNLAGQTSIGQTMAMIADAGLVIANDSAPLHMAVGFDRMCVGLYGPTDPQNVGPYRRADAVLRKYSPDPDESIKYKKASLGDSLMRLISPKDVLARVDGLLAARAGEHKTEMRGGDENDLVTESMR